MEQQVFDLNHFYKYEDILKPGFQKTGIETWKMYSNLETYEKLEIIIGAGYWIDTISTDGKSDRDNIVIAHRLTVPEIRDKKIDQIIN
jgi:hypothetical protein